MPCGGLPGQREVKRTLEKLKLDVCNVEGFNLSEFMRWVTHLHAVDRQRYIVNNLMDTIDLRCKWMMHEVDDEGFMQRLQRREKDRAKRQEIEQVLAMLYTVSGDIIRNVVGAQNNDKSTVMAAIGELRRLTAFAHEGMNRLSKKYNCKTPDVVFEKVAA